jgi:hypothetical protein
MFAIVIDETTAPFIATMNNGVVPKVDPVETTYFLYEGDDNPPSIIGADDFYMCRSQEVWTPLNFSIWQSNGRFAILIDQITAPLVKAMNEGVLPSFDKTISTYWLDECVPYSISSDDFYLLRTKENWTPLSFVVWQK